MLLHLEKLSLSHGIPYSSYLLSFQRMRMQELEDGGRRSPVSQVIGIMQDSETLDFPSFTRTGKAG